MSRGVVRASVCLAASADGRRRVRSYDEDAFTLAATALELLAGDRPLPTPLPVRRVGAALTVAKELVAGALGVPVAEAAGSPDTLAAALTAARAGSAGPEMIVGVCLDAAQVLPKPGEGAFALWIDELGSPIEGLLPAGFDPSPGRELAELFERSAGRSPSSLEKWTGDWEASAPSGAGRPPSRPADSSPPVRVSEGAYVPAPSYRDGIASRWRFEADRCGQCGHLTFPSRGRCRGCGNAGALAPVRLPRDGRAVAAVTWIGPGGQPTEFDDQVAANGPYGVAILDLGDGARATVALADAEARAVTVGSRLDTRLRRLYAIDGAWRYGRKGVPERRRG